MGSNEQEDAFSRCFVNMSKQDGSFDTVQKFLSHMDSKEDLTASLYANESLSEDDQKRALVSHLEVMLRAGYHPTLLSKDERRVMREQHGSKWKQKFGYGVSSESSVCDGVRTRDDVLQSFL